MIGNFIRSTNHLFRLANSNPKGVHLLGIRERANTYAVEGYVFPLIKGNHYGDMVFVEPNSSFNPFGRSKTSASHFIDLVLETHKEAFLEIAKNYDAYAWPISMDNKKRQYEEHSYNIGVQPRIVVADDFDKQYELFLAQNKKITDNVFNNYIERNNPLSKLMFSLANGNANFYAWGIKMCRRNYCSLHAIQHILAFNEDCGSLVKDLTKKNIIALSSMRDVIKALDEAFYLRAKTQAKKTVSWFNPTQKKLLNSKLENKDSILILNNFSQLSKTKRLNFIRKVSTIEDADEIIKMMSFLCTHTTFEWNQDSLLDFLTHAEGLNYEMVMNKPNIVVVKVHDFETIKRLAKTTNWCISKNRSYWSQYANDRRGMIDVENMPNMGEYRLNNNDGEPRNNDDDSRLDNEWWLQFINAEQDNAFKNLIKKDNEDKNKNKTSSIFQYVIFDFSKKEDDKHSIVGVTVHTSKGITHAHDFNNTSMLNDRRQHGGLGFMIGGGEADNITSLPNWFALKNLEYKGDDAIITKFLSNRGITEAFLSNYSYERLEWSREGFFNYIGQFLTEDEYDILYDENNCLLLKTKSLKMACVLPTVENIKKFIPFGGTSNTASTCWFFDFSKLKDDKTKMAIWRIDTNKEGIEIPSPTIDETGNNNSNVFPSFDSMLKKLNLPFDLILRPNNIIEKIEAFSNIRDWEHIIELLKEAKDTKAEIPDYLQYQLADIVKVSIIRYNSLALYDAINNNGLSLFDIMGIQGVASLVENIIIKIFNSWNGSIKELHSREEYNEFLSTFTKRIEKEINGVRNQDAIRQHIHQASHTVNIFTHNFLVYDILNKAVENNLSSFFTKIIKTFIDRGQEFGMIRCDRYNRNLYLNQLLTFCAERCERLDIDAFLSISYLCASHCFDDVASILIKKTYPIGGLKPKHVSMILNQLKKHGYEIGTVGNSSYKKLVNTLLTDAVEMHAISEDTANSLRKEYNITVQAETSSSSDNGIYEVGF